MNFITCGIRWGDKGINFKEFSLKNKKAILGTGNPGINRFRNVNCSEDYIALKDGFYIIALGKAKTIDQDSTWGKILTDEDKYLLELVDDNIDIIEVEEWIDLEKNPIYYPLRQSTVKIANEDVLEQSDDIITTYIKSIASAETKEYLDLLKNKKQIILQGAPGVGKTYSTAELAVRMIDENFKGDRKAIMERYQQLVEEKRIFFTTFHLSLDYEDFVEGYKPNKDENGALTYEVKPGIFKRASEEATTLYEKSLAISSHKNTLDEAKKLFYENLRDLPERKDDTGMMSLNTKGGIEFYIRLTPNNTLYVRSSSQNKVQWHHANLELYYSSKQEYGVAPYAYPILDHLKEQYELISYVDLLKQEKENQHTSEKPIVLIIDEINRGNISKIFGELITLLEGDKRRGAENELKAVLPYSEDSFTVPPNLYIVGTMNTADRSIGMIDYALRRRFAFVSMVADESKVYPIAKNLFKNVKKIIDENISSEFEKDDLIIGHSYFMASNLEELKTKLDYEIKPLLREYLRDGILLDRGDLKKQINDLNL